MSDITSEDGTHDDELVALVDAARAVVDYHVYADDACHYRIFTYGAHPIGTRRDCAMCRLATALEAYG